MTHTLYWLQQRNCMSPFHWMYCPLAFTSCSWLPPVWSTATKRPEVCKENSVAVQGVQPHAFCWHTAPQEEISRTSQGCAAASGQTKKKQIKENNFAAAQYPELEEISQTHQMPSRHKRSSQIFKVGLHPMPRRVTKLAFQKVSTVLLLMLISQFAVHVSKQWFQRESKTTTKGITGTPPIVEGAFTALLWKPASSPASTLLVNQLQVLSSSSFSAAMVFPCDLWLHLARHSLHQMQSPRIQCWCSC